MKRGSCLSLVLVALVFASTALNCQEAATPTPPQNTVSLPDTPSATLSTTCTENNGKPCPGWVHKLIGQYPPTPESASPYLERDPATVHFWTYRGWQDPPLRNNKEVFRSKMFVAAHVGGVVAMIVACRSKTSRETWGSEVPAVAALFGIDYLQFRFVGGPSAVAPAVYEMVHYGRAATK